MLKVKFNLVFVVFFVVIVSTFNVRAGADPLWWVESDAHGTIPPEIIRNPNFTEPSPSGRSATPDSIFPSEECLNFDFQGVEFLDNPASQHGYGSVAYPYEISRYEVTNCQYAYFLNEVAAYADPHLLYDDRMGTWNQSGILKITDSGVSIYLVMKDMMNKPVNYVSWLSAARFVNWLQNRQSHLGADTEHGTYDLTQHFSYKNAIRSDTATFAIPSADEWYKAAYYDPSHWDEDSYWRYATRSNFQPEFGPASVNGHFLNPGEFKANYNSSSNWRGTLKGNVLSVGSTGEASASYFGTQDMNGNVSEWTKELICMDQRCGRFFIGGDANSNYAPDGSRYVPGLLLKYTALNTSNDGDDIYRYWRTGFRIVRLRPAIQTTANR